MGLFSKEARVAECALSRDGLLQTWGPRCEQGRQPSVWRLKRWSLSTRVSDEERGELDGM